MATLLSTVLIRLQINSANKASKALSIDVPNHRSMHSKATPSSAGICIVFIFLAYLIIFFQALPTQTELTYSVYAFISNIFVLACIGLLDDKDLISIKSRLFVFMLLAGVSVWLLKPITTIHLMNSLTINLPIWLGVILSIIGILWLINLFNFMDGMDGLAAMQTIIAATTLAYWFFEGGDHLMFYACVALVGSTLGFLIWNWSPAKIFMGDVGSLALGGFFSLAIIYCVNQYNIPIICSILLLGCFVFDTTYTLLRRLMSGERIYQAHRHHIYQRLAEQGIKHTTIVLSYSALTIWLAVLAHLAKSLFISPLLAGSLGFISVISLLVWVSAVEGRVKNHTE